MIECLNQPGNHRAIPQRQQQLRLTHPATVAGGLAGVRYGADAIPSTWLDQLARRTDLEILFNQFVAKIQAWFHRTVTTLTSSST